jgi:hypothetical protein
MTYPQPHPFEVLVTPHGHDVEIDCELVPIMKALWAQGITTTQSCQGPALERGHAYIVFLTSTDAARFLTSLKLDESEDPESMYQRIGEYHPDLWSPPWLVWRFKAHPEPLASDPVTFTFGMCVEFPPSDIPEITRRLTSVAE